MVSVFIQHINISSCVPFNSSALDLTNGVQLPPRNRVLLEKLTMARLVQKFTAFYAIQRFITVSTTTGCNPEQHTPSPHLPPYFLKIKFNIIISSMCRSCERSLQFRFSDQNVMHISHLPMRATRPSLSHPL
jgi:hypothetical protein